jgi:hypothetical protein
VWPEVKAALKGETGTDPHYPKFKSRAALSEYLSEKMGYLHPDHIRRYLFDMEEEGVIDLWGTVPIMEPEDL